MEPMNRKLWIVLGLTVASGFCYVVFNTEWLKPDPIQIQAQVREVSARASLERRVPAPKVVFDESKLPKDPAEREKAIKELRASARRERISSEAASGTPMATGKFDGVYPVVFALDGEYKLTSIRVIEDTPSQPGGASLIVWQVDTTSNSVPTKALIYGRTPRGMKLKDERNKPAKLLPGTTYRLEVKAGRYEGRTTFQTKETVPAEVQ
jgi:hypothetical protein